MAARVEALRGLTPEQLKKKSNVAQFFHRYMQTATISVEKVSLLQTMGWDLWRDENNRLVISHVNEEKKADGKFFYVEGRNIAKSKREVPIYGQPGIVENEDPSDPEKTVGSAMLLVDRKIGPDGKPTDRILLQINAEPFAAKPGQDPEFFLQIRSSVQGSYDNLKDHTVTFSEEIKEKDLSSEETNLVALNPGRFQGEIRVGVSFVDAAKIDLSKHPNYAWFTVEEIDHALNERLVPFNALFLSAFDLYRARVNAESHNQKAA